MLLEKNDFEPEVKVSLVIIIMCWRDTLTKNQTLSFFGNGVMLFWRQRKISMFNNFETYKSMISDYAWFIFYRFSRVRVGRPKVGEGNGWTTCMFVKTFTKNQLLENGNVDEIGCWQKIRAQYLRFWPSYSNFSPNQIGGGQICPANIQMLIPVEYKKVSKKWNYFLQATN